MAVGSRSPSGIPQSPHELRRNDLLDGWLPADRVRGGIGWSGAGRSSRLRPVRNRLQILEEKGSMLAGGDNRACLRRALPAGNRMDRREGAPPQAGRRAPAQPPRHAAETDMGRGPRYARIWWVDANR